MKLPVNVEAERALIGCIYLDSETYGNVKDIISADDFSDKRNRELWKAEVECILNGQLDLVTLKTEIDKGTMLSGVEAIKILVQITNELPTTEGAVRYAEIVADYAERRRKIIGIQEAAKKYSDLSDEPENVDSFVQNVILAPTGRRKNISFTEAFKDFSANYTAKKEKGSFLSGIPTGFTELDIALGGLEPGKMYVIGARPGIGKSAYALNIASNMAANHHTILYFSLEMRTYEITKRISAYMAKVDLRKIKTYRLSDDELKNIEKFNKIIGDYLIINDDSYQTVQTIMSNAIQTNAELNRIGEKVECIMIDHLHLLASDSKYTDRRHQIDEASRMCKVLAEKLECPVIVLSQLSRANTARKDNVPQLTDLRESGGIEQDADVVLLLHREGYYSKTADQNQAEVIIAKNRDGMTGTLKYKWYSAITEWSELPRKRLT